MAAVILGVVYWDGSTIDKHDNPPRLIITVTNLGIVGVQQIDSKY